LTLKEEEILQIKLKFKDERVAFDLEKKRLNKEIAEMHANLEAHQKRY